jgi:GTPase SAR1 family protein
MVVFDLTKETTFQGALRWIDELQANEQSDVVVMLIGNKCDLINRGVKEETVK